MSAFGVLLDTLLNDPNLGVDLTYTPQSGSPVACRGAWAQPDITTQIGTARITDQKRLLKVKRADVAQPVRNDAVRIAGVTYRVVDFNGDDPLRLTWTLTLAVQS